MVNEVAVELVDLQTEGCKIASAVRIIDSRRNPPVGKLTLPGRLYRVAFADIHAQVPTKAIGTAYVEIDSLTLFILQGYIPAHYKSAKRIYLKTFETLGLNGGPTPQNHPQKNLQVNFFHRNPPAQHMTFFHFPGIQPLHIGSVGRNADS